MTSTLDIGFVIMTSLLVLVKSVIDVNALRELKWVGLTILFCAGLLIFRGSPGGGATPIVIGNILLVLVVVWMFLRCRRSHDEVVRAANDAALGIGAPVGPKLHFYCAFGASSFRLCRRTRSRYVRGGIRHGRIWYGGALYSRIGGLELNARLDRLVDQQALR